jgi:glycine hydroxymethyltransferase
MREPEMRQIAGWIGEVLAKPEDAAALTRIRAQVGELCKHYPAPKSAE